MIEAKKAGWLCIAEYFIIMAAHAIYAFLYFGMKDGIAVVALGFLITGLMTVMISHVKSKLYVTLCIYISVLLSVSMVGAELGILGYSFFVLLCMLCGLTIFMEEKQILISMAISLVYFIVIGFFGWDLLSRTIPSIYIYILYCVCFFFASANLYLIVRASVRYKAELERKTEDAIREKETKLRLLVNMSHEIRTPMNAILGLSELNLKEELPPAVRENSEQIRDSGRMLVSIVSDIFDYARVENGTLELKPVNYSLSKMVTETLDMMKLRLTDKDVECRMQIDNKVPDILFGDVTRVHQILYNLLSNAVNFTDHGYILVNVTGQTLDEDQVKLKVTVSDSGMGIRPEEMENLFHNFDTNDSHRDHERAGKGLGLAISRNLSLMMGGDISAESSYGVGSKFTFTVIQKKSVNPDTVAMLEKQKKNESMVQAPEAKVLIVDDNMVNLKVAEGLFRTFAIRVDCCKSGRECLEILKDKKDYDIIFLDHMMPELDGIETLNLIRSNPTDYMQKVPVIALTANVMSGVREMFLEQGFNDYVPKPIEISWVNTILKRYLPKEKIK